MKSTAPTPRTIVGSLSYASRTRPPPRRWNSHRPPSLHFMFGGTVLAYLVSALLWHPAVVVEPAPLLRHPVNNKDGGAGGIPVLDAQDQAIRGQRLKQRLQKRLEEMQQQQQQQHTDSDADEDSEQQRKGIAVAVDAASQALQERQDIRARRAAAADAVAADAVAAEAVAADAVAADAVAAEAAAHVVSATAADDAAPVTGDPLQAESWPLESSRIDMKPVVPYLGTLIDAGRHYFPLPWLKRVVDRLHDMNYNLIHLRLTDDQTFNVLLESRPQLAYPTAVDNPQQAVYTVAELKELTAYAKQRGIAIMPEINIPGHAGSWAGIPDLIVHCPNFICDKGYGLPLNVTHHLLQPILKDVIQEIITIFDDPPFLHLGGDEVNMADPCFMELNAKPFDYEIFEKQLSQVLADVGYPEDRVVRWEMTGQHKLRRAGNMQHYWFSHPGVKHQAEGPFFVSTWMYFDTNGDQDAYDVYTKAVVNHSLKQGKVPTAIIAGTFELSVQFWYDRNILGRLLAVAIGASNLTSVPTGQAAARAFVNGLWKEQCEQLGFGTSICDTLGKPVIATTSFKKKWENDWQEWKGDICERLTATTDVPIFKPVTASHNAATAVAMNQFWEKFLLRVPRATLNSPSFDKLGADIQNLRKHAVRHSGAIIDVVSTMPVLERLETIVNDLSVMGFNLVQLRLVSNHGFAFEPMEGLSLGNSIISSAVRPLLGLGTAFTKLVHSAREVGIAVMPEITVSTDAAGWIRAGFLANCPNFYCAGKGASHNVNHPKLLPVLYTVIAQLREVFSSQFIHLGTDEREAAQECYNEAQVNPDFDDFERKLQALTVLAGLLPEDIVRSENREGVRYPKRVGGVTQYRLEEWKARPDESAFVTINLFEGNGYTVFQNAKRASQLEPLAVMAELRKVHETKWKQWDVDKRLLAFAMGLSSISEYWSIYDEASFDTYFKTLCEGLQLSEECAAPAFFVGKITVVTETEDFVLKSCRLRTGFQKTRSARNPVIPFYEQFRNATVVAVTAE